MERVLQGSLADCRGAYNECAVGNCIGDGREGCCAGEYGGGIDCGPRCFKGNGIVVDEAEMAEAEVMHGPCHRANIVRIARAYQDDAYAVELLGREHLPLF